jgi:hypothetical protein
MDVYKASRGPFRKKMRRRKDRRAFSRSAGKTRKENISGAPMRLGIRL